MFEFDDIQISSRESHHALRSFLNVSSRVCLQLRRCLPPNVRFLRFDTILLHLEDGPMRSVTIAPPENRVLNGTITFPFRELEGLTEAGHRELCLDLLKPAADAFDEFIEDESRALIGKSLANVGMASNGLTFLHPCTKAHPSRTFEARVWYVISSDCSARHNLESAYITIVDDKERVLCDECFGTGRYDATNSFSFKKSSWSGDTFQIFDQYGTRVFAVDAAQLPQVGDGAQLFSERIPSPIINSPALIKRPKRVRLNHLDEYRRRESFTSKAEFSDDEFWRLISLLDWSRSNDDEKILPLVEELARGGSAAIANFEEHLARKLFALDTREHAKYIGENSINRDFSQDVFLYIRCAAVANGREYFLKVLENPKAMPKKLEFEALLVALRPHPSDLRAEHILSMPPRRSVTKRSATGMPGSTDSNTLFDCSYRKRVFHPAIQDDRDHPTTNIAGKKRFALKATALE